MGVTVVGTGIAAIGGILSDIGLDELGGTISSIG
jgi:hypothetical protein